MGDWEYWIEDVNQVLKVLVYSEETVGDVSSALISVEALDSIVEST